MNACPYCSATQRQIRAGRNRGGSQRFQCRECSRHYTPQPAVNGYPEEVRRRAVALYVEGINFRRIGRILNVNHQSAANWVNSYHASLPPEPPAPAASATVEVDELWTFVAQKKSGRIS